MCLCCLVPPDAGIWGSDFVPTLVTGGLRVRRHLFVQVWGLTSAILIDVARFALGREPDFHAQCDSLSKVMRRGRSQCTQSF